MSTPTEAIENATFDCAEPVMNALPDSVNHANPNGARAKQGWYALHGYAKHIYGSSGGEPVEQGVRDLLSDLQHTCEHLNIDFMEALERASSVFNSEKEHP